MPSSAIVKQGDVSRAFVVLDKRVNERILQTGADKNGILSEARRSS